MKRAVALFAVLSLLLIAIPSSAREGFGFSKRAVKLDRRVPPEVVLLGTALEVVIDPSGYEPQTRKLRDAIEGKMTSYDTRLESGRGPADITVKLTLNDTSVNESWKQKTEYESRKVGTKVEYDSNGKKKEKDVYDNVAIEVNYKTVTGRVSAKSRVLDAKGNEIHSDSAEATFSKEFKKGEGAPSASAVEGELIDEVASKISGKLVGRIQPVSVLVPRASFDSMIAIAEAGNWQQYLQQVEAVTAKKKPQEEAYRQYALGVAREGLAYQAASEETAIELLQKAGEHYRQAVSMNPREELFAKAYSNVWSGGYANAPVKRVESALADYEKLKEQRIAFASAPPRPSTPSTARVVQTAESKTTEKKSAKALSNANVIEMTKAGLSDKNITLAIDGAASTEFELAPEALISMAKAGVSRDVIAHMQKKQR